MSITLKRNYPILLALALVIVLTPVIFHDTRIIAYTVPGSQKASAATINYDNATSIFDDAQVHEVTILISEEDKEKMVTTLQETGEKDYFPADVIIDGVRITQVGIRLKGNASLRSVGGGFGDDHPNGNWGDWPNGGERQPPTGDGEMPRMPFGDGEMPRMPFGDGEMPAFPGGGAPFGGDGNGQDSRVSYLIKFDEYVEGQAYQGRTKLALRSYGISYDAAQLQEPVTNAAFNSVGVTSVKTAYISLQFNSEEPSLYAVTEEPDQTYIDRIFPGSEGVLYKVQQVGNSFRYLGEDPTLYSGTFSQETAKNDADFAPLIAFMRFVTESTDEEFARDLSKWFDVDAFAAYLAANNLVANSDSLAGMGNNYYLYYNFNTERFTILMWDANESLGKLGMGGSATLDLYWKTTGEKFGKLLDEEDSEKETVEDQQPEARWRGMGGRGGGPMGMGGNNLLMSRFFEVPGFVKLYEEKLQTFYQKFFVEDALTTQIETYAALVTAYNQEHTLVDQTAYDAAVQKTLDFVTQRHEFLKATDLLKQ
ncbi:MAG: CotH kinase family protein [Anaerolineae bacterium]|nr:CotH kinase family protein [Anaerolineae bacterium]